MFAVKNKKFHIIGDIRDNNQKKFVFEKGHEKT